jgi:hypothetical protein
MIEKFSSKIVAYLGLKKGQKESKIYKLRRAYNKIIHL